MYSMEICVSTVSIIVGASFSVAKPYCNCGLVPSTGERCSPLQICCRVFSLFYSIFKLRSGCDIWYYVPGFAYTEYHNARPRPDTSTLQPVPESLIVFTKSQGLYVPASIKTLSTYTRKRGVLLHKKCNNCRNVAKLKYKSFVCTSLVVRICAVVTQNYYRNIDENTSAK